MSSENPELLEGIHHTGLDGFDATGYEASATTLFIDNEPFVEKPDLTIDRPVSMDDLDQAGSIIPELPTTNEADIGNQPLIPKPATDRSTHWNEERARRLGMPTTTETKQRRRASERLARILGNELDEPADRQLSNPESMDEETLFDVKLSGRLSHHEVSRVEDFMSRYEADLADFIKAPEDEKGKAEDNKIELRFVDNAGLARAMHTEVKNKLSPHVANSKNGVGIEAMEAIAPGVKGLYSPELDRVSINIEYKKHADDEVLFATIAHELTHYREDQEGKRLNSPKIAKAARYIGKTAVVGLGLHMAHKTNIGPEVGPVDLVDPLIVYAGWSKRKVGSTIGSLVEYGLRPSEIRARREAKRATKKYMG